MPEINFFKEGVSIDLRRIKSYRPWILEVASQYGQPIEVINYIFCTDEYLHHINIDYLNHDTYTDIITFDLREGKTQDPIEADIFISLERILDNAKTENASFETELARVMIHGILHLLGFKDKTKEEKKVMREKENQSLEMLGVPRGTPQKF